MEAEKRMSLIIPPFEPEQIQSNSLQPLRLGASGVDVVLTTSVYAIIGALALQKGGEYAGQVAREKVLKPLGVL